MARKKGKPVNFDVIVKFFMQHYDIPTRADIDRVIERLDALEQALRVSVGATQKGWKAARKHAAGRTTVTAADQVLAVLDRFENGAGCAEIEAGTGFGEKKIRNILYRLHKLGKIERTGRGVYIIP